MKHITTFFVHDKVNENANVKYLPAFQDIEGQAQQEEDV